MNKKKVILVVLAFVILVSTVIIIAFMGKQLNKKEEPSATSTPTVNSKVENSEFRVQLEPERKDLPDRASAEKVEEGMKIQEVYSIMGNPQRDVGSGAVILEWNLDSGEILRVSFLLDVDSNTYCVEFCSIVEDSRI